MKTYQSHKIVQAARIVAINSNMPAGKHDPLGKRLLFALDDGGWAEVMGARFETAKAGNYFVRYEDGYESVSPSETFESGYREMHPIGCDTASATIGAIKAIAKASFPSGTGDSAIEAEIQAKGKTAPRITPADIEANIASEHYFTATDGAYAPRAHDVGNHNGEAFKHLDMLTFCVLVLQNGFTVTGESACASPENFDSDISRKVARENAISKVWPLLGYALKNGLHRRALFAAEPKVGNGL